MRSHEFREMDSMESGFLRRLKIMELFSPSSFKLLEGFTILLLPFITIASSVQLGYRKIELMLVEVASRLFPSGSLHRIILSGGVQVI